MNEALSILERINQVSLIIGGLNYERKTVEECAIDIKKSLIRLGFCVKEIFLNKKDFACELENFYSDICFIADPFYLESKKNVGIKDENVNDIREKLPKQKIKYTGCNSNAAAICKNKIKSKEFFSSLCIASPKHFHISMKTSTKDLLKMCKILKFPLILKPVSEGAGIGVNLCRNLNEVLNKIEENMINFKSVMLEEFIEGIEITVGVLGSGNNAKSLPPVEIELLSSPIYDFEAKQTGKEVLWHVPARISKKQLEIIKSYACAIHQKIDCAGITRIDFRISTSEIFCLEINSSPSLSSGGIIDRSAYEAGLLYDFLILEILMDGFSRVTI